MSDPGDWGSRSDDPWAEAERAYRAELAQELTDADFEPPTLDELKHRQQRERRALRRWLRSPSPRPAPVIAGRRHGRLRRPRGHIRCPRSHRRARSSTVRSARGDPDGDADPDGRHTAAEAQAQVGDKSLGELIGHAQQREASPDGEGEARW